MNSDKQTNFVKKLQEIVQQHKEYYTMEKGMDFDLPPTNDIEAEQSIISLVKSLIGEMEGRQTEDMSLKSWTPEDYKAFGRNQLRSEILDTLLNNKEIK